jgi:hypothetical protein
MIKDDLLSLIKDLANDGEILLETADGAIADFAIEPITISCDDPTVVGYVITLKSTDEDEVEVAN